jgi:hypothetical protein
MYDYFTVFQEDFVSGRRPTVNKVDGELPDAGASLAEVRRLREENSRLRSLLIAHDIRIPESANFTDDPPQVSNSAREVRNPVVATAEQRIALFRSLFRGREDVYAIRWENADGRSGYMPKADRDWKSYLSATAEDRKKVDRLMLLRGASQDTPQPFGCFWIVLAVENKLLPARYGRECHSTFAPLPTG